VVNRVRWSRADVARFVGCYLTEPKSNVVFERSRRPLSASAFAKGARSRGVRLAPPTRMLVRGRDVYMNGERLRLPRASKALAALANMRELPPGAGLGAALASVLYAWYKAGYIEITRS
jgi:50S ribosomal protein L16 3-hydroxylase